jgi:hypothetical protein
MLAENREMSQEISLSSPNFTLTDSEFEAVLAIVCCFLDGSPLSQIHIVRSSYKPTDLEATRSLLSNARVNRIQSTQRGDDYSCKVAISASSNLRSCR